MSSNIGSSSINSRNSGSSGNKTASCSLSVLGRPNEVQESLGRPEAGEARAS